MKGWSEPQLGKTLILIIGCKWKLLESCQRCTKNFRSCFVWFLNGSRKLRKRLLHDYLCFVCRCASVRFHMLLCFSFSIGEKYLSDSNALEKTAQTMWLFLIALSYFHISILLACSALDNFTQCSTLRLAKNSHIQQTTCTAVKRFCLSGFYRQSAIRQIVLAFKPSGQERWSLRVRNSEDYK